jgi:hypothetical protein
MKKKTLYIIITLLVLLNIGQFVYFYSVVSDLKSELRIIGAENKKFKSELKIIGWKDGKPVRNCDINKNN